MTRETDEDLVSIGEVVIGKFAGTEMRGGYPPLSVAHHSHAASKSGALGRAAAGTISADS